MPHEPRPSFQPKVYLPSIEHPDYYACEHEYVVDHLFRGGSRKARKKKREAIFARLKIPREFRNAPARFFRREIINGWEANPRSFKKENERYVINALKYFGLQALAPAFLFVKLPQQWTKEQMEMFGLSVAIREVLLYWQFQAKRGSFEARRRAVQRLKEIGSTLIPSTVGKRNIAAVDPALVKIYYLQTLFRLYQIKNSLREHGKARREKVEAASKNFDMPVELIRELWKLDENDEPTIRVLPIKQRARIVTARQYQISEYRVSNIIASSL